MPMVMAGIWKLDESYGVVNVNILFSLSYI